MKRVRCPKCDNYIVFDETKYADGQALVFVCDACGKEFGVRVGTPAVQKTRKEAATRAEDAPADGEVGELVVLENMFAYRQTLPLKMGDNVIGRYQAGRKIDCPIESGDPSLDMQHAVLTVRHAKKGGLEYLLRDGPSYVGTFVGDELLGKKERRIIRGGALFTLGATSVILRTGGGDADEGD